MFRAKFPGEKRVALGKSLSLALERAKWKSTNFIGKRPWYSSTWKQRENRRNRLRDSRIK